MGRDHGVWAPLGQEAGVINFIFLKAVFSSPCCDTHGSVKGYSLGHTWKLPSNKYNFTHVSLTQLNILYMASDGWVYHMVSDED